MWQFLYRVFTLQHVIDTRVLFLHVFVAFVALIMHAVVVMKKFDIGGRRIV